MNNNVVIIINNVLPLLKTTFILIKVTVPSLLHFLSAVIFRHIPVFFP